MSYEVHSIHINVGPGDSAIHLLVQPVSAGQKSFKVVRACLIDGGMPGYEEGIADTIRDIRSKYDVGDHAVDATLMCFDSVVITHWDQDHYSGIRDYIQEEFNTKAKKLKGETWDQVKPKLEKETISLFRYVDRTNKDSGLLTTLYAPYWNENARKIYGLKGSGSDLPGPFDDGGKTKIEKFNFDFQTPWPLDDPKKRKVSVMVTNLCNLCYEPGKTIGTNFLDNEGLKDGQTYDKIANKSELANNTKSPLPVGIFCIVSKAHVIGNSGMVTQMLPESVDDDDIHVFMEEEKATEKNRLSIGAIVLWKAAAARASHYFAGDLSYEVETKVGEWLAKNGESKIPNIKLRQASPLFTVPASRAALMRPWGATCSATTGQSYAPPSRF
ncbi:hypothetical protein F4810DRAFT_54715 [Camillea tinctor]|nr:hypothetical protein F4810DRAFT_54715 [Camillea tinctor]